MRMEILHYCVFEKNLAVASCNFVTDFQLLHSLSNFVFEYIQCLM